MKRLLQDARTLDGRTTAVLVVAVVMLLVIQFFGQAPHWQATAFLRRRVSTGAEMQFWGQVAWALSTAVCFGVIPFLAAVLVLRMKPSELGFRWRGFWRHVWVYVAFFVVMLPLIFWASKRPAFLATYPFARLARTDDRYLLYWEIAYFLQFCALEMFFRGFLVFGLERRFGFHAIFVMTIPYAMLHYSKPAPEAFGAIFAGIILGYMALRTRSFYGGILLHYAVALTMDLLARSRI